MGYIAVFVLSPSIISRKRVLDNGILLFKFHKLYIVYGQPIYT